MKNIFYILPFLLISFIAKGQNYTEEEIKINTPYQTIHGTLVQPNSKANSLVIIIPGSGPTDRNGNNVMAKNNSLKYLAEGLVENSIASFRYDKSVLTLNPTDTLVLKALRFEHFIEEAKAVIHHFKKQNKYGKIVVAGHSQGSLVGMLASKNNADAFISIAGAGRSIDEVIIDQIAANSPMFKGEVERVLNELKKGNLVNDYNPLLASLFNIKTQPFLMSWMAYNPQEEIANLAIPVLLINGTKDIQVAVNEAKLLHNKCENSEIKIIENMNHVLKIIEGNTSENIASYSNPNLDVSSKLIEIISNFINE